MFKTWFEEDIPLQYALAKKLTPELQSWFSKTKELVHMMLRFTPEYLPPGNFLCFGAAGESPKDMIATQANAALGFVI